MENKLNGGQNDCTHDFTFDTRTKTLSYPCYIHGVCTKCGAVTKITYKEWKSRYLQPTPQKGR